MKPYQFDLSRLGKNEMNRLWATINKINFDESITINRR